MPWKNVIPRKRSGAKRPRQTAYAEERHALQRDINRVSEDRRPVSFWTVPFDEDGGTSEIPRVDVEEGRKTVNVMAELPRLSEPDVQLALSSAGDVLDVTGEPEHEHQEGPIH